MAWGDDEDEFAGSADWDSDWEADYGAVPSSGGSGGSGSSGGGGDTDWGSIVGATLDGAAAVITAALGGGDSSPAPSYGSSVPYVAPKKSTTVPVWVWVAGGAAGLLLLARRRR